MPSKYTYPQLLDANVFARKAADSFYWQCTTRTVQESKLFPVNPYIALSYLNAWYRWPELLRKIDAAMPAEEIGDRARNVGSYVSTITMGLIPQFYLGGRQILIDMGMLRPTDALDDVMFVLDFGRRVNMAYHRNHAHTFASDANQRAQILTERQAQVFEADAIGVKPGDKLLTALGHFMATVSAYGFLSHCECRLSFNNHGPYRTAAGEMIVRDLIDLAECDYPWMDGVAAALEHNNLTVPVVMKDTHFHIVDDWGSFEATPAYDASNIVAVGLYTSDYLSDGYIPVAHGLGLRAGRLPRPPARPDDRGDDGDVEDDGRLDPRPDDRRRPARLLRRPQGPRALRRASTTRTSGSWSTSASSASSRSSTTSTAGR